MRGELPGRAERTGRDGWVDPGGHVGAGTRLWHQAQVSAAACVGTDCTLGAGAIVAPGVTVGAHAMVALGAIVAHDVPAHALVAGNPARQCGWVCRCGHTLHDL
ncbi:MAG: hypothetical protein ACRDXB_21760, partial [Actinomycetes bacterium]